MRRYISEIIIVVLASCVLYLFRNQAALNQNIIEYYKTDKSKDMEEIQRSRSVIETNSTILRDLRQLIREATHLKIDSI